MLPFPMMLYDLQVFFHLANAFFLLLLLLLMHDLFLLQLARVLSAVC